MWLVVQGTTEYGNFSVGYPLAEGDFFVGRDKACNLVLEGRSVSRKHVCFTRKGTEVTFKDQGSVSGTFVNGRAEDEGLLKAGDKIRVGHTIMRVEADFPGAQPSEDNSLSIGVPARAAGGPVVDWTPFREFFKKLRDTTDSRAILERLLLGLVQILKLNRGFVLLRKRAGSGELHPVASYRLEDEENFIAISSTVYKQVLETETTTFIADSSQDTIRAQAPSLDFEYVPRSIICGPLKSRNDVFGVIYIDGPANETIMSAAHIPLFEMLTEVASELLGAAENRRQLLAAKGRLVAYRSLQQEETLVLGDGSFGKELKKLLEAAAPQDVTVLLTGETGTGKEMAARAIHEQSQRADEPFVPVNCAALPREIIEAELFGAEKGAYTGAEERRIGRFELASSGTLFLDEIGELPLDFQVKLLRVLQERKVTRLGGTKAIPLKFRLVCATNRDLEAAVREGTFRQDIYYRINVFRIHLKPLRERVEDIPPLASHFVESFCRRFGRRISGFTPEAERLLLSYGWPGNIRELKNAIERAVVVESEDKITASSLPIFTPEAEVTAEVAEDAFFENLPQVYDEARALFERSFLRRSYVLNKGNIAAMARDTGIPRNTVYRRLEKYGLLEKKS